MPLGPVRVMGAGVAVIPRVVEVINMCIKAIEELNFAVFYGFYLDDSFGSLEN